MTGSAGAVDRVTKCNTDDSLTEMRLYGQNLAVSQIGHTKQTLRQYLETSQIRASPYPEPPNVHWFRSSYTHANTIALLHQLQAQTKETLNRQGPPGMYSVQLVIKHGLTCRTSSTGWQVHVLSCSIKEDAYTDVYTVLSMYSQWAPNADASKRSCCVIYTIHDHKMRKLFHLTNAESAQPYPLET